MKATHIDSGKLVNNLMNILLIYQMISRQCVCVEMNKSEKGLILWTII